MGLSLLSLLKSSRSPLIYLLLLTISYSCYIVVIGGDFLAMFRFFVPIVPPMAILVQEGVISFCQWFVGLIQSPFIKKSSIAFFSFIFIVTLALGLTSSFKGGEYVRYFIHQGIAKGLAARGKWLHKHAYHNETVAAIGIGAISYYSELNTIDRLGMTDIHIAHTKMPHMGKGFPGHEKRNLSYVLSKKPTYISGPLIYPKNCKYFKPTDDEIKRFNQLYEPFYIEGYKPDFPFYKLKEDEKD